MLYVKIMSKANPSLRGALILVFTVIAFVLITGYSFLSTRYFMSGMDTIIVDNLNWAATVYADDESGSNLKGFDNYKVTREWHDQPAFIVESEPTPPIDNQLQKLNMKGEAEPFNLMFFYMAVDVRGEIFYVSFYISPDTVSEMVKSHARESLITLLVIGLGSAASVALVVWWFLYQLARPVARLGVWARELNEKTLDDHIPDFGFRDLNDFARLVRNSLISVKEGLDREQSFLRHTSHELRTPISVIQNNIELLRKLKEHQAILRNDPREIAVVERIERASQTMKDLTTTLLWLGKTDNEPLFIKDFRLDLLIKSLVDDLGYLLKYKDITVSLVTKPYSCKLPEAAVQIVLGNLIRNAFQHTMEGGICITQRDSVVEIVNDLNIENEEADSLGFGLGLELTAKLTHRLGWGYHHTIKQSQAIVCVCLNSEKDQANRQQHAVKQR
ncbi:histidine kinase A domain protein [Halomonas sp. KO116]|nr:histidine kinase A domain protein [Halomonas sp. KO116]